MSVSLPRRHPTMKELPIHERPRERFKHYGPSVLSPGELLAVIIRTGTKEYSARDLAEKLLTEMGGLRNLALSNVAELAAFHGMGEAKAIQVLAAFELGRRLFTLEAESLPVIRSPRDAAPLFMSTLRYQQKEFFLAAHLNTKNQVITVETISIGTLNSSLVHPRELFKSAVKNSSAALIMAHNHPSGDPEPSKEDLQLTKRLQQAGELMGIAVLDHLIIGGDRFISLKERGLM